ncbi:polyprenyl synthetase family protein [Nocardioides convexus]|uniref:polyprenyl synthetase family protein n=1 Tax=Nocardioides convexus TaxID=2712224 RepID=UPI0024187CA0|nr:polyprenyl synthetase family protein [Nocardioides convexus]
MEEDLYAHASSRAPYVTEAARHLLAAGGKRFRPLLVLLAAEAGPRPDAPEVLTAASVVEITHVGSLYHDDVMDEAALRRGEDSANARYDNLVAILTGDWLFAKSSEPDRPGSARRRCGSRPRPSPGWSRARSWRP